MGDGDEPLLGQFPQGVDVRPHVQLAADQHHFGVGTELLCLPLPLRGDIDHTDNSVIVPNTSLEEINAQTFVLLNGRRDTKSFTH